MRFNCSSKRLPHHKVLYLGPLEQGVNFHLLISTIWKEFPTTTEVRPRTFGSNRFGMESYLEIEMESKFIRDKFLLNKYFSFGKANYPVVHFGMINKTTGLITKHQNIQSNCRTFKIHIKGIESWMKKDSLIQYFEEYGAVKKLILVKGKKFGFLTYVEEESFRRLCSERIAIFLGVPLICSKSRKSHSSIYVNKPFQETKKICPTSYNYHLCKTHEGLADESADHIKSSFREHVGNTKYRHPSMKQVKQSQERVLSIPQSNSDLNSFMGFHQLGIIDSSLDLDSIGTNLISTVDVEQVTRTTLNIRQGGVTYQRIFNHIESGVFAI